MNNQSIKKMLAMLVVALCMALPFQSYQLGWLSLISYIPLIYWLDRLTRSSASKREKILKVYILGALFFGLIMTWLYNIEATKLIENSSLAFLFIAFTFCIISFSLALGFLFFGWLLIKLDLRFNNLKSILLICLLWGFSELFRSSLFSLISSGSGFTFGPHWNFGSLGFASSVTPIAYISRVVGLYGLSSVTLAFNSSLYLLAKRKTSAFLSIILVIMATCCLGSMIYSGKKSVAKTLNIGIVSLPSSTDSSSYHKKLYNLVKHTNENKKVDTLVFPEYSNFFDSPIESEQKYAKRTTHLIFKNKPGLVIDSRVSKIDENKRNAITYSNKNGKIFYEYYKSFLIPAGEFIPYFYKAILYASGNHSIVENFNLTKKVIVQKNVLEKPYKINDVRYGALACSGAISPELYRLQAKQGADILTNSASLSTIGLSPIYYEQSKQMARFHAVANNKPFIQSARGGKSYIINHNGQFKSITENDKLQYASSKVNLYKNVTTYSRYGEWLTYFGGTMILLLLIKRSKFIKNILDK